MFQIEQRPQSPDQNRRIWFAYVPARLVTPSVTEDTFQDKSNQWNQVDFNDKRCPAGPLRGTHYPDNSDWPGHVMCVCVHWYKLVPHNSSAHPLIFNPFSLFIPCSLCFLCSGKKPKDTQDKINLPTVIITLINGNSCHIL